MKRSNQSIDWDRIRIDSENDTKDYGISLEDAWIDRIDYQNWFNRLEDSEKCVFTMMLHGHDTDCIIKKMKVSRFRFFRIKAGLKKKVIEFEKDRN